MRTYFNSGTTLVLLLSIAVIATPAVAVWSLSQSFGLTFAEASGAVGSIGTLVVIAFGAIFAVYQFRIFRHNEPHLSVTQSIEHRLVSEGYIAFLITAELRNTSKVAVAIHDTLFRIQQFDHFSDGEIEQLYASTFIDREHNHIQWPTLEEVKRKWRPGEIKVEPGETHSETYEFIVGKRHRSIIVYSLFYNPDSPSNQSVPYGWQATTMYSVDNSEKETR